MLIKINSKWIIDIIKKHNENRRKSFNGLGKGFLDSQMHKPLKKNFINIKTCFLSEDIVMKIKGQTTTGNNKIFAKHITNNDLVS